MNIVLYEPEMPANTGNIGRTCVATNTKLHLIEPLGFKLSEKHLVRAGLDYWDKLDVTVYSDYQDFLKRNPGAKIYMATTKGEHVYTATFLMIRMPTSCSGRRAVGSRRRSWWKTVKTASGSRCGEISGR